VVVEVSVVVVKSVEVSSSSSAADANGGGASMLLLASGIYGIKGVTGIGGPWKFAIPEVAAVSSVLLLTKVVE
jgi:hypothetical protein